MRCWLGTLALAFAMLCSSTGHADAVDDMPLAYTAPAGCAERATFVSALRARAPRGGDGHHKLSVAITHRDRFYGKLVSEDDLGHISSREISATTCAEVADGLALAAAMSLEQEAPEEAPPSPVPAPAPVAAATPTVASEPAPPPSRPQRTLDDVVAAVGVGTVGTIAYAPSVSSGAAVFAEAQSRYASFRVGAAFALTPPLDVGAGAGKATFVWGVARMDLCPRGVDHDSFTITACARAEFGSLQAHVFGTSDEDTHPWLAAGLALRLRYLTGSSLFFELEPWAVFSVLTAKYILPPGVTVQDGNAVGGGLTLSVGSLFFR